MTQVLKPREITNEILSKKSRSSALGQICLLAIAAFALLQTSISTLDIVALSLILIANLVRVGVGPAREKFNSEALWYQIFAFATLSTAVGWGLLGSGLMHRVGVGHEVVVLLLIIDAGIVAAATAALSPDKVLARLFTFFCLGPLIFTLVAWNPTRQFSLALVLLAYLGFLFAQIRIQSDLFMKLRDRELDLSRERERAGQETVRLKSEFLATISHELRTPLNAIIGISDLLETTPDASTRLRYIKALKNSGELLLNLVKDILDFSQVDGEGIELENSPFNLTDVVEGQIDLMTLQARQKGLVLSMFIDPKLPSVVKGDFARIGQALLKVIDNAVKFTEKGSVNIRCWSRERKNGSVVIRFEVEDTGVGITEEKRIEIFKPFSQADGSMKRKHGGAGLGLSFCKRLIEMMDGKIDVESEVGKGAKFWFDIPLEIIEDRKQPRSINGRAEQEDANLFAPARVLVAEDNSTNQMLTLAILNRLGLHCQAVVNGREAVAAWESGQFDLILMDCQMPDMDGYEATAQIRRLEQQRAAGQHIPIVALTANVFEADRDRCESSGMDGFIAKPLRRQVLIEQLKTYLKPKAMPA